MVEVEVAAPGSVAAVAAIAAAEVVAAVADVVVGAEVETCGIPCGIVAVYIFVHRIPIFSYRFSQVCTAPSLQLHFTTAVPKSIPLICAYP
jgi:hypothetical protein